MEKQKCKLMLTVCTALFVSIVFMNNAEAAGTATVSWIPPTTDAGGGPLTGLAGYRVYYATSSQWATSCPAESVESYVDVPGGSSTSYTFNNLTEGQTYYFTVLAYDSNNNFSSCASDGTDTEVSKFIPLAAPVPVPNPVIPPIASGTPIYRFWSDAKQGHFYTASESEKDSIIANDKSWKFEGPVFKAFNTSDTNLTPIYRFWSQSKQHHFYTASAAERDSIIANDKSWSFEGTAYQAYLTEQPNTTALYRFWSDAKQGHFYTTSVPEKDGIIANDKSWNFEGIAYFVPVN